MLGSSAFRRKQTTPYVGAVRNSTVMRLTSAYVLEATRAEARDCPAGAEARARLAEAADPEKLHRIHTDSPVMAVSLTRGYAVEVRRAAFPDPRSLSRVP